MRDPKTGRWLKKGDPRRFDLPLPTAWDTDRGVPDAGLTADEADRARSYNFGDELRRQGLADSLADKTANVAWHKHYVMRVLVEGYDADDDNPERVLHAYQNARLITFFGVGGRCLRRLLGLLQAGYDVLDVRFWEASPGQTDSIRPLWSGEWIQTLEGEVEGTGVRPPSRPHAKKGRPRARTGRATREQWKRYQKRESERKRRERARANKAATLFQVDPDASARYLERSAAIRKGKRRKQKRRKKP